MPLWYGMHQPHSQADPTFGLWIACSMHILNGKAQEIWSHAVASRRQRVDKQGWGRGVLDHNDSLTHPQHHQRWTVLMLPCECSDIQFSDRNYKGFKTLHQGAPPVYPLSTWHHHTWPNLPGLHPPCLHTASVQRVEVRTAWEWGYTMTYLTKVDHKRISKFSH